MDFWGIYFSKDSVGKGEPKNCRKDSEHHRREDIPHLLIGWFRGFHSDSEHRQNRPSEAFDA